MTALKRQLVAAVSAGSLLFSSVSSVFAATTLEISGNGSSSDNVIKTKNTGSVTVVQSNTAVVTNSISSSSSTGKNSASMNTGGDVAVRTGNAKTEVKVEDNLNSNHASVNCCASGDLNAKISGNGAYSDSEIKVKDSRDTAVFQNNTADVENKISADAKTGHNDADKNTGGDVMVVTGDASTKVTATTSANSNYAQVGGSGASDHGSVSLKILGNGSYSDNNIRVYLDDDKTIVQDNLANVYNSIKADAKTGHNDANKNTGGDVAILTGDAKTHVMVDNAVNFNWADVDCGCVTHLLAKVDGNGSGSDNYVKVKNDNDQDIFQGGQGGGNNANLHNSIWSNAKTGHNDANKNTGDYDSDPWVMTGDSASYVDVSNSGNVNSYGADMPTEWPAFDFHFTLSLNWADLLAWIAAR